MSTSHTVFGRDYGRLFDMISAPIKTRLLQSGLDLGVFDRLKAWITASEAAKHIGIHLKNAVPYLDASAPPVECAWVAPDPSARQ